MYVYECLFVSIYVICTAQVIAPTSEAVLASTSLVCSSAAVAILSATSVHGICWIFALMLPGSPWVWGSLYLPIFLYESNMIYIYFPSFSYMNLYDLYVPRVSKLAASCSFHKCHAEAKATPVSTDRMALRSTSFSSPRLSFATQLLGYHHDIIMISWATQRFHLNPFKLLLSDTVNTFSEQNLCASEHDTWWQAWQMLGFQQSLWKSCSQPDLPRAAQSTNMNKLCRRESK